MKEKKLFEDFPPVTAKEWLDRINIDLKGADFNRKLVWKTDEGFDLMPFYRKEDLESIKLKNEIPLRSDNSWLIRQDIDVENYEEANRKALSLITKGIDSFGFKIADPESINSQNLRILLRDIDPASVELNFLSEGKAREIVSSLADVLKQKGIGEHKLRGCIEADPLGRLMVNGTLCIPEDKGFDYLAALTSDTLPFQTLRNIRVTGSHFKDAGSGSSQELAFCLSMAVEYLHQLTKRGLDPGRISGKIRFSFGTGPYYFIEIAKLRAARILWPVILDGFMPGKGGQLRMEIHSVTTNWNKTVYDPWVNLLRTQTEAMSAIIGGTDSLTVSPFDSAVSRPGEFSERLARNQQLILREEALFGRVADPSAGSYYVEKLTAGIVESAWKLFLETENNGGFLEALRSGFVQDRLSDSSVARKNDISKRKEVLVGTNKYPDLKEKISPELNPAGVSGKSPSEKDLTVRPVKLSRAAEEIEKIRIAVDKSPEQPKVFLLTIGNPVFARARAQFSAGFFGCAGYRIIDNEIFTNARDGVDAALKAGADIVVVCSSDEEYPAVAPGIFRDLAGRAILVIAGNPASMDELKAKGVQNFISIKSDLCETLHYYNNLLGITRYQTIQIGI